MVGLVIVSHSAALAEGVRELIEQMTHGATPLALAGGLEHPNHGLGTDPLRVLAAIESVYTPAGVVVLMDLGSALLSAETALELLDPAQRPQVHLCEAPLVEGALAAAVRAMTGGNVAEVMAEARAALVAKAAQLGLDASPAAPLPAVPASHTTGPSQTLTLTISNPLGLHARPAARVAALAQRYQATLILSKPAAGRQANAASLNQIALLGARQGDVLEAQATGPEAVALLAALQALAADHFGDAPAPPPSTPAPAPPPRPTAPADADLTGIPASAGVALGPLFWYRPEAPAVVETPGADPQTEWQRLERALDAAIAEVRQLEQQTTRQVGATEAAIFTAHRLMLEDPEQRAAVRQTLETTRLNAAAAWQRVVGEVVASYRALPDPYLSARAADVRDVGQRVVRQLLGVQPPALPAGQTVILAADELTPSDMASLATEQVLGILTMQGGATSHSAILARAAGLPAIVGIGPALERATTGQWVGMDGAAGHIWLTPTPEVAARLQQAHARWRAEQAQARQSAHAPACTQDGVRVETAANIGAPRDVAPAVALGAEGVGLFRTEFLFFDRSAPPDEASQFEAYRLAVEGLAGRPLIIRTLDIGGDKPIAYLEQPPEANPFLGWRGVRYCLAHPDLFRPQLRAICRASALGPVLLMFPMVSTPAEVRQARTLLAEVQAELAAEGLAYDPDMPVGVMIETPAAAVAADALAPLVDFFSLGTNDLTQYVMAADRGNPQVAALADPLQPAVVRAIQQTVQAGHAAGIWVGMCGELAGDPLATPLLVGLGLDELSMSAPAIPAVKAAIRALDSAQAQAVTQAVLALDSAPAIRAYLQSLAPA